MRAPPLALIIRRSVHSLSANRDTLRCHTNTTIIPSSPSLTRDGGYLKETKGKRCKKMTRHHRCPKDDRPDAPRQGSGEDGRDLLKDQGRTRVQLVTHARRLDRRKRIASQLGIDIPPAQVVDDHDVVSLIAQVQTRRPAAESVPPKHDDLLLVGAVRHAVGRHRRRVES